VNTHLLDIAGTQLTAPATRLTPAAQHKLEATSKDFEGMFLSQMLEIVWATVPTDGAMGGGTGESIFRSMMIQDIGRQMAQQGGIGLSSRVKEELLALQEVK
jgi:Rod binding domain-containing protein